MSLLLSSYLSFSLYPTSLFNSRVLGKLGLGFGEGEQEEKNVGRLEDGHGGDEDVMV